MSAHFNRPPSVQTFVAAKHTRGLMNSKLEVSIREQEREMSIAVGPRHGGSGKRRGPARRKSLQKEEPKMVHTDIEQSAGKLFTFTFDADTAQIVKFEARDANGAQHELSDEEKASLAQAGNGGGLEDAVERAFEAGIACVLGGEANGEKTEPSKEDEELRHLLLTPLIERSAAKRLLEQEALSRILLRTLILHSAGKAAPEGSQGAVAADLHAERPAAGRSN